MLHVAIQNFQFSSRDVDAMYIALLQIHDRDQFWKTTLRPLALYSELMLQVPGKCPHWTTSLLPANPSVVQVPNAWLMLIDRVAML